MKRFLYIFLLLFVSCKQETYFNITTSVLPSEGGSITLTPSFGSVLEGAVVSFQAKPSGDYIFTGWSGSLSGADNPKTVTVTSDLSVVANFKLKSYPLIVSVEGEGTVDERVISTKTDYGSGTVVELTAQPSEHWLFDHWEGDLDSNTNPVQITVSSPKSVKAVFVKKIYDLTVSIDGEGAVSETVVGTRSGSYQEGSVVELTATPATGWSFNHWEGDTSGSDNPTQITVSGAKSVKAVFTRNKYAYSIKIVGPGVIDEYVIPETRADYDWGTKILLKAVPSDGTLFKGWSGDVSGIELEKEILVENNLVINAVFERKDAPYYPPVNLNLPSRCYPRIYPHIDLQSVGTIPTWSVELDYNRDGYIDLVSFPSEHKPDVRPNLRFYLGAKDFSLAPDGINDSRMPGLVDSRKGIYGDYNRDGLPDICIIGGGYDEPPYPGGSPVILMSNATNSEYKALRNEIEWKGFWHGGTSGDFDNDGDLDIFFIQAWHGGNFTIRNDLFRQEMKDGMYNCELYDFDKDGFLDLIVGAHDHANSPEGQYKNMPIIFWGNGENYTEGEYSQLSKTPIVGMGVVNDFYPYDLDGDGVEELVLIRTGDGERNPSIGSYKGWCIQVFKRTGRSFQDVTYEYFKQEDIYCIDESWIVWMEIITEDDGANLYFHDCDGRLRKMFKLENKHFVRIKSDTKITNGICLYSDGNTVFSKSVDLGWTQNPYVGNSCIRYNDWEPWTGYEIRFPETYDFSELVNNGYSLEFFVKNSDPSLVFSLNFTTEVHGDPFPEGQYPTYFKYYWGVEHPSNGQWECVRIPLSDFECADNLDSGYHWNKVNSFRIWAAGYNGHDFYLDEIRIRKVLPE